jgi:hypothetical protein
MTISSANNIEQSSSDAKNNNLEIESKRKYRTPKKNSYSKHHMVAGDVRRLYFWSPVSNSLYYWFMTALYCC